EQYELAFEVLRDFAGQNKDTQGVIEAFGLSVLRMPLLPSEIPADPRHMILIAGRGGAPSHTREGARAGSPTGRRAGQPPPVGWPSRSWSRAIPTPPTCTTRTACSWCATSP